MVFWAFLMLWAHRRGRPRFPGCIAQYKDTTLWNRNAPPSRQGDTPLFQAMGGDILRVSTAGSVDDGKSTLIGRLLYDTKSIYDDQLEAVEAG